MTLIVTVAGANKKLWPLTVNMFPPRLLILVEYEDDGKVNTDRFYVQYIGSILSDALK